MVTIILVIYISAYCLSYRYLNNVDITTVIEMVEMVEILDGSVQLSEKGM